MPILAAVADLGDADAIAAAHLHAAVRMVAGTLSAMTTERARLLVAPSTDVDRRQVCSRRSL